MSKLDSATGYLLILLVNLCISPLVSTFNSVAAESQYDKKALAAAEELLKVNMNWNVEPCEDFYEFACGGAKSKPDANFNIIEEALKVKVKQRVSYLLGTEQQFSTKNLRRLRNFHDSCGYLASDISRAIKPIRQILEKIGGIPAIGQKSGWIDEGHHKHWTGTTIKLRQVGLDTNSLLGIKVGVHKENRSRYAIYLDRVELDTMNPSEDHYKQIIDIIVPDRSEAEELRAMSSIKSAMTFKVDLINILGRASREGPDADWNKRQFSLISVAALQELIPTVEWTTFLGDFLQHPIAPDEDIFIWDLEALRKTAKLIQETHEDVLIDYAILEALWSLITTTYSAPNNCDGLLTRYLGLGVATEYARYYVTDETHSKAAEMVEYLKRAFDQQIYKASWISKSSILLAIKRVDSSLAVVGFVQQMRDEKFIEELHSDLDIKPDQFVENVIQLQRWHSARDSAKLGNDPKSVHWTIFESSDLVKAFYSYDYNSINILPGTLGGFLYNSRQPAYINYAALGSMVAHEIAESLIGGHNNPNLSKESWLDEGSFQNYTKESECVEEKFSRFKSSDKEDFSWVDAKRTLKQNMADFIANKVAFEAYTNYMKEHNITEPLLPGLSDIYRAFWVSLAQNQCNSMSLEHIKQRYQGASHSPPKLRVNVPIANRLEFTRTFKCASGSPMNPDRKCKLF